MRLRLAVTLRLLGALALTLWPRVAAACATCIASPYGDRSYNWAYLGLLLAPFGLAAGIGGVLTHCYFADRRRAAREIEERHGSPGALRASGSMRGHVGAPHDTDDLLHEETT